MNRKTLLQVFFRRDDQKFEYKRQVYTLFDSFAKIGGIFGILVAAIQILLKFFIENLFFSHMITRLYQLEDNHERIYLTDTSDYDQGDNKKTNQPLSKGNQNSSNLNEAEVYELEGGCDNPDKEFKEEHPRQRFLKQEKDISDLLCSTDGFSKVDQERKNDIKKQLVSKVKSIANSRRKFK